MAVADREAARVPAAAGDQLRGRNDFWKAYGQEETKRQAAGGIKAITFDAATTAAYLKQAYDTGWEGVVKLSPQHGPQMQKLFTKK